jgi:hypothetical protein
VWSLWGLLWVHPPYIPDDHISPRRPGFFTARFWTTQPYEPGAQYREDQWCFPNPIASSVDLHSTHGRGPEAEPDLTKVSRTSLCREA